MFDFFAHAGALGRRRPDLKLVANQEVEVFLGSDAIVPVRFDRNNRVMSSDATCAGCRRTCKTLARC